MTQGVGRPRATLRDQSQRWSAEGSTRIALANQAGAETSSEERKEMEHRILMAAASLFNRKGFAGATTRELAQSLGLQRASLYHYLESKQDLLYALCVASMETAAGHFTRALASAAPEDRLRSAIRAHITAMVTEQDMHAVMLTELRSLDADRRDEVRKLRSAYEGQWRDLLQAEQAAGRLRSDVDTKFLALTLLNLVNWPIFWYRVSGPIEPGELADRLTDLFLEGALPQPASTTPAPRRKAARRKASQG